MPVSTALVLTHAIAGPTPSATSSIIILLAYVLLAILEILN